MIFPAPAPAPEWRASARHARALLLAAADRARVRSATIGGADTLPECGLSATVSGTRPFPLAELTWGNTVALCGGPSATRGEATGVDFGLASNLIGNVGSNGNANTIEGASLVTVARTNRFGPGESSLDGTDEHREGSAPKTNFTSLAMGAISAWIKTSTWQTDVRWLG